MSRFKRRTLAAIVGLSLGWFAGGFSFPTAHAEEETAKAASPAVEQVEKAEAKSADAEPEPEIARSAMAPKHGAKGEKRDEGQDAASRLVPINTSHIAWFRPVLGIIFALFVFAVILGWPAAIAKGPPPAEPADDHAHDAKHDDHAHGKADAHGHSH